MKPSIIPAMASPTPPPPAWGSFHTPSVDLLIHQSDAEYTPPPIPFPHTSLSLLHLALAYPSHPPTPPRSPSPPPLSLPPQSFISQTLSTYPLPPSLTSSPFPLSSLFPLTSSFIFINHAAFGTPLLPLTSLQSQWLSHLNSQPLRFIDRELLPLLVLTLRRLARFLHCPPSTLALLPNVTTALTSVITSMALHPRVWGLHEGGSLLFLSVGYGAVKKQVRWLGEHLGVAVVEVTIRFPLRSLQSVVAAVEEAMNGAKNTHPVRVAFFDHVTSNTALLLPLQDLIRLCESQGVKVVVDGAHGPWQLPLDLAALHPTCYAGNLHKWMCNPRGAAFLYCASPDIQRVLHPPAMSHGYGTSFTSNFLWLGCQDYAALLTIMGTLDLWEVGWEVEGRRVDRQNARDYAIALCRWAACMLAGVWGTSLLYSPAAGDEDVALCMTCVDVGWGSGAEGEGDALQERLYQMGIECPVKTIDNALYVRISAHIYNQSSDYIHLAHAILRIREEMRGQRQS